MINLMHGDCLEVLRTLPDNSVDAVVTDPPYGLSFMGKRWDYDVPATEVWAECLRVLKPGGHLLAFAGTRTQHRMAVRIEDAGFEIRDMIAWVYGSGFPKSRDISKDMDRIAGAAREVVGQISAPGMARTNVDQGAQNRSTYTFDKLGDPVTEAARQWQGWGTALKPALEPITVARKPLSEGTVAANVLAHGTGAINVDGCRVNGGDSEALAQNWDRATVTDMRGGNYGNGEAGGIALTTNAPTGRWPANLIHDGSEEVLAGFPVTTSGGGPKPGTPRTKANTYGEPTASESAAYGSSTGSAARFFYCAKASKRDRDEGLEGFEVKRTGGMQATADGSMLTGSGNERTTTRANIHPTVKPTDLMRYLCRLVTPPGGIVLDPFMGSGSTGKAARLEGFQFIGIEREAEYLEIARARINAVQVNLL